MARNNLVDLRRGKDSHHKVTAVELFFDLMFVFAITQLSHALLADVSIANTLQLTIVLCAVWWVWIYTSWVTNWLNPEFVAVRIMLFGLMLAGLVMSAAIPKAFSDRGMIFAAAFVLMQVGRTFFAYRVISQHDAAQGLNLLRILCWFCVSGLFWIAGGFLDGQLRLALWTVALLIEYAGPLAGFYTPGLGRSFTSDWRVSGEHMAERCGLFIIIALGESILVTGATFAGLAWKPTTIMAFSVAFAGSVAMWWIYFNVGAEEASHHFSQAGRYRTHGAPRLHLYPPAHRRRYCYHGRR